MELTAEFQFLLTHLDYVSLPGLGSFIKKYEPAKLAADGKSIAPPHEYYTFDTTRNFNDGAMENYLQNTKHISADEASQKVNQLVNNITIKITNGESVLFKGIGELKTNAEGNIELKTKREQCATQTFGLQQISVKPTNKTTPATNDFKKPETKKHAKHKLRTNSSSRIAFIVAICFATVAFILILTSPRAQFWNKNEITTTSVTTSVTSTSTNQHEPTNEPTTNATNNNLATETATQPTITEQTENITPKTTEIKISTDKKSALLYTETPHDSRTHYIIVGSYSQKYKATTLINRLKQQGYKPELLEDHGSYRVALYKFVNRDRALRELERIKAQHISDDAWLHSF